MEEKWDIGRRTRVCAQTGQPLNTTESFFSAIKESDGRFQRCDYCPQAWPSVDKSEFLYYWKSQGIEPGAKPKVIDFESMLMLFDRLAADNDPAHDLLRYILGLLLGRRRILRLDAADRTAAGDRVRLFDKRTQQAYEFICPAVTPEEIAAAQEDLNRMFE